MSKAMETGISKPVISLRGTVRRLKAKFIVVSYLIEWAWLLLGLLIHALRGKTPWRTHFALVNLFVMSQGRANDCLARILSMLHPPYHVPQSSGVLGNLSEKDLARKSHA